MDFNVIVILKHFLSTGLTTIWSSQGTIKVLNETKTLKLLDVFYQKIFFLSLYAIYLDKPLFVIQRKNSTRPKITAHQSAEFSDLKGA